MKSGAVRPLIGLASIVLLVVVVAVSLGSFAGKFTKTVPVTVITDRAGLVMSNDAKVKMRGVQVGQVKSITTRDDGTAVLDLAIDPEQMHLIPSNVTVEIEPPTAFGAKAVNLVAPDDPSTKPLQPGAEIPKSLVTGTVEINTVFQQLTRVLGTLSPEKLNATLSAIATAFDGRGQKFGQLLSDFEAFLAKVEPSLPAISRDFEVMPGVFDTYADAAPDLVDTLANLTTTSQTIVDEQQNLDAFLLSAIGLADVGNEVVGGNREALTTTLQVLVPTTDLLNEYHRTLTCVLQGIGWITRQPPLPEPGVVVSTGLNLGIERYRYPTNLPKVAAHGPSRCEEFGLPVVPFNFESPHLVVDDGTNPMQYGNPGILLNSDALKQLLYGPIAGPPRNTPQIGMPG